MAGAVAAVVTLAALATAPLPDRPATGGYDAAGAADAPAVDPFIEDEALAEFVEPEQLVAVPVGPGRVAKPVQMVLSGGPVITALGESGIPDVALRAYKQAEARLAVSDPGCGVPWTLLAAIGRVESNHGQFGGAQLRDDGSATRRIRGIPLDGRPNVALIRDSDDGALDGDSEYDRAVGPMQFIPSTWRAVNADGNGDGFGDPNNMFDAAQGAAQYLCTGTSDLRDPGRAAQAVRRYNNADSYVRVVLALARMYQAGRVIGLPSTGDQLPNDPVDPPAARRWAADSPAAPPWTADPPTERPWTAAPPAARPWPTNPQPDDAVVAQPAPVQRTEPSAPPPRGVSRPRTTTPPPDQPTPAAPSPGKTAIREPAPTTPSEPPTVRPPQPRPTTNPTPAAPEPTQTRPSAPTRPSEPEPTTTPNPSEPATTRPPNPAPSGQGTTRPTEPVPSEARTTRPSEPGPSEPATKRPPAPKATESKPSESEPKPSEPSKSGSSTSAPSAEPTPAQEPTTAAVGWAPAMRQVVGRALARPACPPTPTPPPAQPSETCPDDSPEQSPARDDKDRHRCTPQNACKAAGSPR